MSCEKIRQQISELKDTFPAESDDNIDAITLGAALRGACDNGGTHTARLSSSGRRELIESYLQRGREFLHEHGIEAEG